MTIKVDLHVHTKYSADANIEPKLLKKYCEKHNIVPAITDHNELKVKMPGTIPGEEILTEHGEIIGLFLQEKIPKRLSIEETIDKIREQDGLICAPHPFDWMRRSSLRKHNFPMDIIEVFNARVMLKNINKKALDYANKNNIIKTASSDAHFLSEVGTSYAIMDEFNSKKEFLKNLKKARLVKRRSPNINKLRGFLTKCSKLF